MSSTFIPVARPGISFAGAAEALLLSTAAIWMCRFPADAAPVFACFEHVKSHALLHAHLGTDV